MDVGGWLRSFGLERYEAAFRENEIDEAVLPNLTAGDLKDLGVGIVGHRRKLLDAIAALGADVTSGSSRRGAKAAPRSFSRRSPRGSNALKSKRNVRGQTCLFRKRIPLTPICPA